MKKLSLVFIHLLLWIFLYAVLFVALTLIITASNTELVLSGKILWVITLLLLPVVIIPFYIFYFLYPALLARKKGWYLASVLILLIMPLIYLKLDGQPITMVLYHNSLLLFGFFALLGFLFRSFLNGITDRQLRNELQRKQLQSELTYLKAQVNPHFLFNSLNNIDALIDIDPKLASQSLIDLADIMRYMIYESTAALVPVTTELAYLTKVIALYKLRYNAEKVIAFRVSGDTANYSIPPLLLLPLIENVFKHQSTKYSHEAIVVVITIANDTLTLSCSNPYDEFATASMEGGFGLSALRRRLDLLFPGSYVFEVAPEAPIFRVSLRIPLVKV